VWLKRQFVYRFEVADSSQRRVKCTGTVEVLLMRACSYQELPGRLSHESWFEVDRESYSCSSSLYSTSDTGDRNCCGYHLQSISIAVGSVFYITPQRSDPVKVKRD
jgi:hypothetical protein